MQLKKYWNIIMVRADLSAYKTNLSTLPLHTESWSLLPVDVKLAITKT